MEVPRERVGQQRSHDDDDGAQHRCRPTLVTGAVMRERAVGRGGSSVLRCDYVM